VKFNIQSTALLVLMIMVSISCFAGDIPAPNLKAKTLDGQSFNLASEKDSVVVINFWATWCTPCRDEMPALDEYYKKYKSQGLKVLAISVDDASDDQKVKEVMKAFSFPAALERDADYSDFGRIWHVPMTFVIDRKGILRRDGSKGDPKIDLPTLEQTVTPLLQVK